MSQPLDVVPAGSFCWNEQCTDYGIVGAGNLRRYGKTPGGVQRLQCKRCHKVFAATFGTPFYGIRDPDKMLLVLSLLADRVSLRGIHRITRVKPDTTLAYLERAAAHVELIESLLQRCHKVTRVQLDALWAFVGHKGEKGGAPKRRHAVPSGAPAQSTSTHGCGSAAPSRRRKRMARLR